MTTTATTPTLVCVTRKPSGEAARPHGNCWLLRGEDPFLPATRPGCPGRRDRHHFGIFLPEHDDLWLYLARSKVTSDFIADRLEQWGEEVRPRFLSVQTLVINLDNGPENHSRRTQFLKRIVEFARKYGLRVQLAYSPPYHSKSNPIERCWGILEMPWNGSLLDSIAAVVGFAESMTWKGKHPVVRIVETTYATGVRLKPGEMEALESGVKRLPTLEKWFVEIPPRVPDG